LPDSIQYSVILRKPGFQEHTLNLNHNQPSYFDIRLNENKQYTVEKIDFRNKQKRHKYYKKIITYSMTGLTVLSGITTVYLRQKADQRYEHYLNSGNISEMNFLFNRTRYFDRLAAFSYGGFQICFGTSLYLSLIR